MMPQVLTRLKITEVSAVDRGAGDGTKIVLMKRDDRPRSKPHLERYARRLRKFQEMFDGPERDRRRSFNEIIGKADDRDDSGGGGASAHHASKVADLLVEAGSHPDRASALSHLLHKPSGQALLARMHKAAAKTEKESNMRTSETLENILKDCGPVSVCKAIVDRGRSPCGESELVAALTKAASEQHPELRRDQAFSKLFEGEESVRRAISIAKSAPFAGMVLDYMPHVVAAEAFQPQVISGGDWRNEDDRQQAWEALAEIGRRMAPTATPERQFALAFEDPKNVALAQRVHQRPGPTTVYAFPTAATAKSDHSNSEATAYGELMRKAEEHRSAHPELSVAQCFEAIYTDRANIELAKRERVESTPR